MKRFLIPLLAAFVLPTTVTAGVDPAVHNLCKDVSDYMGCVKANSKKEGWNPFKKTAKEKELEKQPQKMTSKNIPNIIQRTDNFCSPPYEYIVGRYCATQEGYDSGIWKELVKADRAAANERAKDARNKQQNKNGFWKKLADGLSAAADYVEEEDRREEERLDREAIRYELLNRNNPTVIYRDSQPSTTIIQQPTYSPKWPTNCQGYSGRHVSSFACN